MTPEEREALEREAKATAKKKNFNAKITSVFCVVT